MWLLSKQGQIVVVCVCLSATKILILVSPFFSSSLVTMRSPFAAVDVVGSPKPLHLDYCLLPAAIANRNEVEMKVVRCMYVEDGG